MLDDDDRKTLLSVARASIRYGFEYSEPLPVDVSHYSQCLREDGACFVTLKIDNRLRGCIGSLQPWRPLVKDCAENAFAAAFRDPRFPPLSPQEYDLLDCHISLLGKTSPVQFDSEETLVAQLRPGVDGLVLEDRGHRGTFLPAVWQELTDPRDFLTHLKLKAGLPAHYWSDTVQVSRYTVDDICD